MRQEDQAGEVVGASTAVGQRLANTVAYAGMPESIVLLQEPRTLGAGLMQGGGAGLGRGRNGRGLSCSPVGHGSAVVRQIIRWNGRRE